MSTARQFGKSEENAQKAPVTTDPFHGGVRVLTTSWLGFERAVQFALDENPPEISDRERATLDK